MARIHLLSPALLCLVALAGCTHPPSERDGRIQIVATTGMVADVVARVGGDRVHVRQLMTAGVDPHLYKATSADVIACDGADMIFYSGLHLEGKMADMFERLSKKQPVFAVTQNVAHDKLLTEGEAHDPHVWFDVDLWRSTISVVRDALAKQDEANAALFTDNAKKYDAELAALHAEAKEKLAAVAKDRRVLVTAHDAFRYFGRAYDIEVHGIQGISTESEAGVAEVNRLIDLLVSRKIKAVFIETSVSDQNIKSLLEGCSAKGHEVTIGGELFSDAMGAAGTPEGTYPGMVRHNVETIVGALK